MDNQNIKEILEYVLSLTYGDENAIKGINKVEDYITNLEECYCNRTDCSARIKDSKKYDSLLQEYEKLQEENQRLKEELKTTEEKWNKDKQFSKCRTMEMLDYKSRNKKAIEYIGNGNIGIPRKTRDKFIAILEGEDKK